MSQNRLEKDMLALSKILSCDTLFLFPIVTIWMPYGFLFPHVGIGNFWNLFIFVFLLYIDRDDLFQRELIQR